MQLLIHNDTLRQGALKFKEEEKDNPIRVFVRSYLNNQSYDSEYIRTYLQSLAPESEREIYNRNSYVDINAVLPLLVEQLKPQCSEVEHVTLSTTDNHGSVQSFDDALAHGLAQNPRNQMPEHMIMRVNRNEKHLNTSWEAPLTLTIRPDTTTTVQYELCSLAIRPGFGTEGGHYFCYLKNQNNQWIEANDSRIGSPIPALPDSTWETTTTLLYRKIPAHL